MRSAHGSALLFGPEIFAAENTGDLQCPEARKYNASHWNLGKKRRNSRTMENNRGALENTMRSNKAIIALWTSGCNGAGDCPPLSAWLARPGASQNTKSAERASRKAQFNNSHLCH